MSIKGLMITGILFVVVALGETAHAMNYYIHQERSNGYGGLNHTYAPVLAQSDILKIEAVPAGWLSPNAHVILRIRAGTSKSGDELQVTLPLEYNLGTEAIRRAEILTKRLEELKTKFGSDALLVFSFVDKSALSQVSIDIESNWLKLFQSKLHSHQKE